MLTTCPILYRANISKLNEKLTPLNSHLKWNRQRHRCIDGNSQRQWTKTNTIWPIHSHFSSQNLRSTWNRFCQVFYSVYFIFAGPESTFFPQWFSCLPAFLFFCLNAINNFEPKTICSGAKWSDKFASKPIFYLLLTVQHEHVKIKTTVCQKPKLLI